jgi:hypothetical protein
MGGTLDWKTFRSERVPMVVSYAKVRSSSAPESM